MDSRSENSLVICRAANSKLFNGSSRFDSQIDGVSQSDSSFEVDNLIGSIQTFDEDQNEFFGKSNYNASEVKTANVHSQEMEEGHTVISMAALTNMMKNTDVHTKPVLTRRDEDFIESTTIKTHKTIMHSGLNSAPDNGVSSRGRNSQTTSVLTNDRVKEAKLEAERAVRVSLSKTSYYFNIYH